MQRDRPAIWMRFFLAYATLGVFFLGCLPLLAYIFRHPFLPSAEWILVIGLYGQIAGILMAGLMLFLVGSSVSNIGTGGIVKKIAFVFFAPLMGYALGSCAITLACPLIFALINGGHVEISFIVKRADGMSIKFCTSPVEVEGLPFLFDKICSVSSDVRRNLQAGSHIVVTGRGNSYGVFAEGLRKVD
jgi:hypothetical protein